MLPYDIVTQILEFAADDYGLLFQCSLVTREFNCAASQLLYFHVVVSPPFRRVLNLRDTGSIPVRLIPGTNLRLYGLTRMSHYGNALDG